MIPGVWTVQNFSAGGGEIALLYGCGKHSQNGKTVVGPDQLALLKMYFMA